MSDELIKSLNQRIQELEKRKDELNAAVHTERKEKKALKLQYDELLSKVDEEFGTYDAEKAELAKKVEEYEAKFKAAPDEKDAAIGELKTKLVERDHRDAWKDMIGSELHEKATVEKLWREIEYKPDGEPDPIKITEWVGKAKESAPYLFRSTDPAGQAGGAAQPGTSQAKTKTPLTVNGDGGRGARDTTGGPISYKSSDIAKPGWQTLNKPLAEAIASGNAVWKEG